MAGWCPPTHWQSPTRYALWFQGKDSYSTRCTHRQRLHCRVDLAHVTLPRACQNGACTPMLALSIKQVSRSNHAYTRRGRFCGVWEYGALQYNTCCSCCRPCCCCCRCCCCHQERKVLRVVCRWDLGAQLVKELLDDLKVKCLLCRRALGVAWVQKDLKKGSGWKGILACVVCRWKLGP
jgi:hypothetical protein